jgi:serine/threonine-protein kinase
LHLPLALPARIAKYELEEYLGGGMSEVYRARDTVIGRTVAVKILTDAGCADPDLKARFLQEARLAGNIDHDNVVCIYDFGVDERQRPFMVMEFLRGVDLRRALRDGQLGDLKAKLRIALQIAKALGYIHSLGIVHRDIKPENIHLTSNGVVKLMDFGIAKSQALTMTRTGSVMGTPHYMAPEQVLGETIGPAVDIYAFGALFYELLTGLHAVKGDSIERLFYAILHEPVNLEQLNGRVPQAVCDLIARCMAKSAAERPASFESVAGDIEAILTVVDAPPAATLVMESELPTMPITGARAGPVPPAPTPAIAKPKGKVWLAVIGIALLAVTGVLVKLLLSPHRNAKPVMPPVAHMVPVPAGEFLFGNDNTPVQLPAFYIDRTEVTNAAYGRFCKEAGHALPPGFAAEKPDYPVVNVTIADAREFAHWAGKRLPNAQEWEKAARGTRGRLFPWGDDRIPGFANVRDNALLAKHEIMPAVSFSQGASPYGALNMVGNAWELVDQEVKPLAADVSWFAAHLKPPPGPQEPWYEIRGAAADRNLAGKSPSGEFEYGGIWDWSAIPARYTDSMIGFRCVQAAPAR